MTFAMQVTGKCCCLCKATVNSINLCSKTEIT